ncbi:MAG: hypothetical protein MZV70_15945 [Desulfobacterales bacterium]|nr:hypothetical protein [Desulfobacterales bacterium]
MALGRPVRAGGDVAAGARCEDRERPAPDDAAFPAVHAAAEACLHRRRELADDDAGRAHRGRATTASVGYGEASMPPYLGESHDTATAFLVEGGSRAASRTRSSSSRSSRRSTASRRATRPRRRRWTSRCTIWSAS